MIYTADVTRPAVPRLINFHTRKKKTLGTHTHLYHPHCFLLNAQKLS